LFAYSGSNPNGKIATIFIFSNPLSAGAFLSVSLVGRPAGQNIIKI